MPMLTKKTGMKILPTAPRSVTIRSWPSTRPRARPAMNAPMMKASLVTSATAANARINMNETTTSVEPPLAYRFTRRMKCGTITRPTIPAPTRNKAARPIVSSTVPTPTSPPVTDLTTTVRITSPSTSSTTAAPRTIRDSSAFSVPRSPNTRAVIPTLVAVSAAPMNTAGFVSCPSASATPKPVANGTTTPITATAVATPPTRRRSIRSISMPTRNSSNSTPTWASTSIDTPRSPVSSTQPSTEGPMMMPPMISPSTAGVPIRSASSPNSTAAPSTTRRSRSRRAMSTAPSVSASTERNITAPPASALGELRSARPHAVRPA